MNYIERALKKSDALWRAQEQTLRGSPDPFYLPPGTAQDKAPQSAQSDARDNAAGLKADEEAETESLHNETPEAGDAAQEEALRVQERMEEQAMRFERAVMSGEYRRRLTEKLLGNADERAPIQKIEGEQTASLRRAETERESSASGMQTEQPPRQEEGGVRYLVQMLRSAGVAGLFGAKETPGVTVSEIVREGLDAQTLSRGLERDARRYDGGFLLY